MTGRWLPGDSWFSQRRCGSCADPDHPLRETCNVRPIRQTYPGQVVESWSMHRRDLILAASALAAAPRLAVAATAPLVVLELFTSQGCSSCPPADALLTELAPHPGIVALTWHVDYWNNLGWRD